MKDEDDTRMVTGWIGASKSRNGGKSVKKTARSVDRAVVLE